MTGVPVPVPPPPDDVSAVRIEAEEEVLPACPPRRLFLTSAGASCEC